MTDTDRINAMVLGVVPFKIHPHTARNRKEAGFFTRKTCTHRRIFHTAVISCLNPVTCISNVLPVPAHL